jgi:hypothetical protein
MMADELNINKETICQMLHEDLWKRKICAQSSTFTDSWMSKINGNSQHAKTSSTFVKTIPLFLITVSLFYGENCSQRKEITGCLRY